MTESASNKENSDMLHARIAQDQGFAASANNQPESDAVETIGAILERPDDQLDYARAKIAFDRLVDPSLEEDWVLAELDRLAGWTWKLAGPAPNDSLKLGAVRRVIYDAGEWNGDRPFAYDMSDPLGQSIPNKLLHNYLRNHLGQCVSMPVLFLILAERLGLNVALCTAPEHVFVRYTDPEGRAFNIETTSGGHPARDQWFREKFPITDRAIESGLYLRTLTKREGIAVLALVPVEFAIKERRFEDVIALCKALLPYNAVDAGILLSMSSAYSHKFEALCQKHPTPWTAPMLLRAQTYALLERSIRLFAAAERLGWIPFPQDKEK